MNDRGAEPHTFDLIGENLALDFANSIGGLRGGVTYEHLRSYADLLAWSRQTGILSAGEVEELGRGTTAATGAAIMERAMALRETVHRIFSAIARGATPAPGDLALLNGELSHAQRWLRIVPDGDRFGWGWAEADAADRPLWRVARSAAELLTSPDLACVRECAGHRCSWLFVDTTRNHSRRWCDMRGCGNVAKVRRHRRARKAGAS